MPTSPQASHIDVAFPLSPQGDSARLPQDHGYIVYGGLCRLLSDLHGADWLAIHPLRGKPCGEGQLELDARSTLRLRITAESISQVLPLAQATLDVAGYRFSLGSPTVHQLTPARSLKSRLVTIKGFTEVEAFAAALGRQMEALGASGRVEIGRRRITRISDHQVVGFAVLLRDLRDDDSLLLQSHGLGGRQRMGCGVLVPA